jgi:3-hydroxyisobutyrate dehydrogenase
MKIGVLGIGLMGQAIATTLSSNYEVIAYNRSPEKLAALEVQKMETTTKAQQAIAIADHLILTLSDAAAIELVLWGEKTNSLRSKTIIQMGTIAPEESKKIAQRVIAEGGKYLEAPVLGSIPEAKTGKLLVMVGGEEDVFQDCLPILATLGEQPNYIGAVGEAAALKLALNQLIAALTAGFSLSLGLIQRENVDVEKFMAILRDSALYAPTFDKKLQRMGDRHFENPNFPTKHLLKDTKLFLQAAQEVSLNTIGLEGTQKIIEQAIAASLADTDYSAIYNIIVPE